MEFFSQRIGTIVDHDLSIIGNCFCVFQSDIVVSAYHVLSCKEERDKCRVAFCDSSLRKTFFFVEPIRRSFTMDVIFLKLFVDQSNSNTSIDQPITPQPLEIDTHALKLGDKFQLWCHSLGNDCGSLSFRRGSCESMKKSPNHRNFSIIRSNYASFSGDSGAPVLMHKTNVAVGIHVSSIYSSIDDEPRKWSENVTSEDIPFIRTSPVSSNSENSNSKSSLPKRNAISLKPTSLSSTAEFVSFEFLRENAGWSKKEIEECAKTTSMKVNHDYLYDQDSFSSLDKRDETKR